MRPLVHRLRDRLGVRATSALAAAVAIAVVLAAAGVGLVYGLERVLMNSVEQTARASTEQLGTRIEANFSGTGDPKKNAIEATGKRTDITQVVTAYSDETGAPDDVVGSRGAQQDVQIIGSSDPLGDQPRMVPWLLAPDESRTELGVPVKLTDGRVFQGLVFGEGFRADGRPITVYAAMETSSVTAAVDTVKWLLIGGIPLLVLITGYFTFLFAGGALRPVERMRARVAGMGERDLSQRVPEPASHDEVGRLARTMNQMLARIEESQLTQRRFVADASHELRSPLATVSTGLELLGAGMTKDSADGATVATLRGETARLTTLVEDLLFLARADERGVAPSREEVDLDEIVDAERGRPAGGSAVTVTVRSEPVRVVGDRNQLVRVVRNLVDNARRHASSTVAVSLYASHGGAVIDVDDDGAGVPESDRQRVFERFVRLDESRARGDGGSGLGLSIVSELVAAHGGTVVALESPELGGARFRVTIPAAGTAGADEAGDGDAGAPEGPGSADPAEGTGTDAPGASAVPAGGAARQRPEPPPPWRRAPQPAGSPYDDYATRPMPRYADEQSGGRGTGQGAEPGPAQGADQGGSSGARPAAPARGRRRAGAHRSRGNGSGNSTGGGTDSNTDSNGEVGGAAGRSPRSGENAGQDGGVVAGSDIR
ncbi:sensor histidine kinase [Pseudonocardia phyllosphaerae]|uniref:sensor histidine kinase n=1 Tax=Pseudonocardia phyllosphaerae TaxID=3390502 RepID=UPI00397E6D25